MLALRPLFLGVLAIACTAGCTSIDAPLPPAGSNGWQAVGETNADGPRLTPLAVIEDSVCLAPTCEHPRTIKVLTRISLGGGSWEREEVLSLGQRYGVSDGSIELVAVYPAIEPGKKINLDKYRFAYRFDGGL